MQSGKDSTHPDNSFPYWQSHSHGDPSVSLALDSSPKRGAKGVDSTRRVSSVSLTLDSSPKRGAKGEAFERMSIYVCTI